MTALILQLHKPRAALRASVSLLAANARLAAYFHEVRSFAGSFLVAEYPLEVIQGFHEDVPAVETANKLAHIAQKEGVV